MKKVFTRRQFMAAAGVAVAAGALTACGGSSASTADSAAGSAAASGSTIKVGVMGPLTGDASVYGQAVVNGASLYIKQVNADGGVNGKQLEVIAMDEQGDETQAVTCFTKMVDQGITALVGDVTTAPTLAVAAESADYNMPTGHRLRYRRGCHLRCRDRHRERERVPCLLYRPLPGREDGRLRL